MTGASRPDPFVLLVLGGLAAAVAFRAGLLPGGLVGVDVLLAAFGWWLGSWGAGRATSAIRKRVVAGFRIAWPGAVAAVGLAVVWVLVTSSTAQDGRVRGEALGIVGGYGNWHQASRGPSEGLVPPVASPLQGVWAWSVLVQVLVVWTLVFAATRRLAVRRRGGVDPIAQASLVLAGVAILWVVVGLLRDGLSPAHLTVGTDVRAIAFLLGAAFGAAGSSQARVAASVRSMLPVVGAGLLLVAVVAGPGSGPWRSGGALLAPILAALAVAGLAPRPAPGAPTGERDLLARMPARLIPLAVALAWVHGPVVALVQRTGLPWLVASVLGVAASVPVAVAVDRLAALRSDEPGAVERRRVLVPPLVVGLLILVLSVTGAFHWESPRPSDPDRPIVPAARGLGPGPSWRTAPPPHP